MAKKAQAKVESEETANNDVKLAIAANAEDDQRMNEEEKAQQAIKEEVAAVVKYLRSKPVEVVRLAVETVDEERKQLARARVQKLQEELEAAKLAAGIVEDVIDDDRPRKAPTGTRKPRASKSGQDLPDDAAVLAFIKGRGKDGASRADIMSKFGIDPGQYNRLRIRLANNVKLKGEKRAARLHAA